MKRQAYVLYVRRFLGHGIPFPPLCVCIFMLHLTRVAAVRISESKTPMAELVMTEDVRHDLEEGCNLEWFIQVRERLQDSLVLEARRVAVARIL